MLKKYLAGVEKHFRVTIFYVYQDPKIAWKFTQEREIAEGRHVPKKAFINAFSNQERTLQK